MAQLATVITTQPNDTLDARRPDFAMPEGMPGIRGVSLIHGATERAKATEWGGAFLAKSIKIGIALRKVLG